MCDLYVPIFPSVQKFDYEVKVDVGMVNLLIGIYLMSFIIICILRNSTTLQMIRSDMPSTRVKGSASSQDV